MPTDLVVDDEGLHNRIRKKFLEVSFIAISAPAQREAGPEFTERDGWDSNPLGSVEE
jgi:hypothetical protein